MSGINNYDCQGILTINSLALNQAWVCALDLTKLWVEVDKRGRNRVIPGAAGVVTLPVRNTETRHNLGLLIVGDVSHSGGTVTDARATLADNVDEVYDTIVDVTGVQSATLTVFGQSNRSASVQVLGMREQRTFLSTRFSMWRGTLEINIPGGRFE